MRETDRREIVEDLINEARYGLSIGEDWELDLDIDPTLSEVHELIGEAEAVKRAVSSVLSKLRAEVLGPMVGEGNKVILGENLIEVKPARTWKVKPDKAGELWDQIEQNEGMARRLFNPNSARSGGFDALAVLLFGHEVDRETGEIIERDKFDARRRFDKTYLDVTEGDLEVVTRPPSKQPKYVERMEEGRKYRMDGRKLVPVEEES